MGAVLPLAQHPKIHYGIAIESLRSVTDLKGIITSSKQDRIRKVHIGKNQESADIGVPVQIDGYRWSVFIAIPGQLEGRQELLNARKDMFL
jgi:hypothetical protein